MRTSMLLFIFYNICYINAENSSLHCCPPDYYVLLNEKLCLTVDSTTVPIRLDCHLEPFSNYKIGAEKVEIFNDEFHSIFFGADVACVGNETTRENPQNRSEVVLMCTEEQEMTTREIVYVSSLAITSIFLMLTAIVYCILVELRDLFGKSIINFSVALAMGNSLMCILSSVNIHVHLCAPTGFFAYFFLMAAFFWMTAISVQVYKSTRPSTLPRGGWRELAPYAAFAWGSPVILTIIVAIVNFHPGGHQKPRIGFETCWFYDNTQQWIYMYSVMSILIAVNVVIFAYMLSILWRHTFASTHVKVLKHKCVMALRLAVLMGITWIFEMIVSLIEEEHVVIDILNMINALQGIPIFLLLVVFRKKTVRAMYKRGWLDCMSAAVERYLAGDDEEGNPVQQTDVLMSGKTYVSEDN